MSYIKCPGAGIYSTPGFNSRIYGIYSFHVLSNDTKTNPELDNDVRF